MTIQDIMHFDSDEYGQLIPWSGDPRPIEAPLPFRGFRIVPGCPYWPDFCLCLFPCELQP